MTDTPPTPTSTYVVGKDEKSAPVMVYTVTGIVWGDVVVREQVRVSTWLRTNMAPDNVCIFNAKALITTNNTTPKPIQLKEIHISLTQILAIHLIPPAQDPPDYDPTEPNRVMTPAAALVGTFRFDGKMRMSTVTNLAKYIEITRENFTGLYEVDISCPVMPALGTLKVPFVLVRQATTFFALT
jgi:hypothetical protein